MRASSFRRVSMVIVSAVVLALLTKASFATGSVSAAQVLLSATGLVFGYIVVRLTQAMFAADPARRRTARRGLVIAAAVPILVLTPTEIGSSPPEFAPMILMAAVAWLALAMSYTSYVLARAPKPAIARAEAERRRTASILEIRAALAPMEDDLRRLSYAMFCRGGAMVILGLGAVMWPEPFLVAALMAVGAVATIFGLYDIVLAVSLQRHAKSWRIVLTNGVASLGFGLVTVTAPGLTLNGALVLIAPWFLLYAGLALRAATLAWPMRSVRWALLVWGAFDVALAMLVVWAPAESIFALLFFGAIYAGLFGAWQVAIGVWLHGLHHSRDRELHGGRLARAHA